MTLSICFEIYEWSLAIGYLVSTNMASLLWTHEDENFNISNVILSPAELFDVWYKLLMLTKIIKENDMVKEDVEDFYEFHFSLLFYCLTVLLLTVFHSHDICQQFVKKWTGRIVSNSLFFREVTCCYNRLWEFSVTYVIIMSLSKVFVLQYLDSQTLWL